METKQSEEDILSTVLTTDVIKRKAGRPKKGEVVAKKSKNRGTLGRPAGDKAIMDEFKARMLNSPKSARVLEAIFDAALDNDHKAQSAAWKLIVDRIVPVSSFEQVKQGGGAPSISINITGLTAPTIDAEEVKYGITDVEIKEEL
jgi:hypothetical protein